MLKKSWLFLLLLPALLLVTGCADGNSEAPLGAHPDGWFVDHRATADINECGSCHGVDLKGSGGAPSCFAASFDGRGCHPDGPGQAPHPLDGSYLDGASHGPEAKADLTSCQICHSDDPTGGPGSNPRFNVGVNSVGGNGCESCHGTDYAHPQAWAGPNSTFHYSAGNIQAACTLCHGAALDGAGGVGVSCLDCHAETTNLTLDCVACHGNPPDGSADVATATGVAHNINGGSDVTGPHDVCVTCHGMKESTAGGSFSANSGYALFDQATESNGDHWDGNINMNADTDYKEANFGCDAAGCHGNDPNHQLSDSGLPVELGAYGAGGSGSVPHALDGSFLSPANHGPAAEARTAAFPNGMLDCQPCHAQAGTDNPRFNVGINAAGGNGCESCHPANAAHPGNWYDVGSKHSDIAVADLTAMCVLCHDSAAGGPASGGVGPACSSCHPADPLANASGCASCHNLPPDGGAPVGNLSPNRAGSHTLGDHSAFIGTCSNCHEGFGFNTADHFDATAPASVEISNTFDADGADSATYDPVTGDCTNVSCHGGAGNVEGPW